MSTSKPIEVRDMAIVHRLFRQAYDEAARLVRAAVTLTQQEWVVMGKRGMSSVPRNKRAAAAGMMLGPLNADERSDMMKHVPAPLGMLFPLADRLDDGGHGSVVLGTVDVHQGHGALAAHLFRAAQEGSGTSVPTALGRHPGQGFEHDGQPACMSGASTGDPRIAATGRPAS